MWAFSFGTILALLISGFAGAQYSSTTCIKDPYYILLAEAATKDTSVNRYYYICSNTVLQIKPYDWDKQVFINSTGLVRPLVFIYPNAHIVCGPDGKLSNNCVMKGGTFQLEVTDALYFGLPSLKITNISVHGIQFTGMQSNNDDSANVYIFGASKGTDLLVKDCVFQDNVVVANIKFEDNYLSNVTVDGSAFKNNRLVDSSTTKNSGLVFSDLGGTVTVKNSYFVDNTVNTTYQYNWYGLNAIINVNDISGDSSIASKVDVQNCCFMENQGISFSLVVAGVYGDGNITASNNFATLNSFMQSGSRACYGAGQLYMDPAFYYDQYYNFTLARCLYTFTASHCSLAQYSTSTPYTSSAHLSSAVSVVFGSFAMIASILVQVL